MTAMFSPRAEPCDAESSAARLFTLPLDDTRDSPTSARYSGGVDAAQTFTYLLLLLFHLYLLQIIA